jgi:hypothetical protein
MVSIGDGVELLKLANKAANADLYIKLAKWVDEVQELKAKVEKLEETNKDLREQLRFKGEFLRISGWVFIDGDDEPLCSRCSGIDHKPVHLLRQRKPETGDIAFCPQCKNYQPRYRTRASLESTLN